MSNCPSSCRKSKRVAKRQEDEIFWLMHNFPQGIDYNDLCQDKHLNNKSSPPSLKTKDLISSVNEKLNDESSAKVAIKMPRFLRSGKRISQETAVSSGDDDKESVDSQPEQITNILESRELRPNRAIPPNIASKNMTKCVVSAQSRKKPIESSSHLSPRTTRSQSLGNSKPLMLNFDDLPRKRRSAPIKVKAHKARKESSVKKSKSKEELEKVESDEKEEEESEDDLTPEEKAQIEKIEQSKLPKFKAAPNKICTRSGATYAFSWKSAKHSIKIENPEPESTVDSSVQSCDRVTRASRKNVESNLNIKSAIKQSPEPLVMDVQVKVEMAEPEDLKSDIKRSQLSPSNHQYSAFLFQGSDSESVHEPIRPKTLNIIKKGKRKRLSLLPTQKQVDEDLDWLEALNRNQPKSPVSLSCSRSESSISPSSSVSSENIPTTPRRIGRTASLNCRAVLSALMRPESNGRKVLRKSPPTSNISPKQIKPKLHPESFFKIKVNPSYTQKVEFIQNGCSGGISNSAISLQAHESRVIDQMGKLRVTTNGWKWVGSHIKYCSFYQEDNVKSTRLYYSAMHRAGVELRVGDSVALQTSDSDKKPFVGKIISMWQDNLGEMMVTMCWFYRPSDLENIKTPYGSHELYLSKHTDDNSVATIQNKVFVLSFPEYCRYYSHLAEKKQQIRQPGIVPNVEKWRSGVIPSHGVQNDSIYFCRGVYDFRLRRTLKQQLYYTKYL